MKRTAMGGGMVAAVLAVAGLAGAISNEEIIIANVGDANARLDHVRAKLAQTAQSTSPPAVCISNKLTPAPCAAVAEMDEAHGLALDALAQVDAIDAGTSSWSLARRLDRLAWSAEANRDALGIISPEYGGIISPEYAAVMTTDMAGIISPEISYEVTVTAGIISPEVTGIISPERTQELVGIISPEYSGLSAAQRAAVYAELDAIAARAEADLVLAHAARRALDQQN